VWCDISLQKYPSKGDMGYEEKKKRERKEKRRDTCSKYDEKRERKEERA
jgi:hypothetical protein